MQTSDVKPYNNEITEQNHLHTITDWLIFTTLVGRQGVFKAS